VTASRASRWRLHRGGILNIWQFGERVFDFSEGRVILQGANGSGKSRTLELLLPLCLDGDLRHLGAKGYDSVSIRRLMLDDYSGGPNRIGYSWVELCRATADGSGEEFITSGVGVKASRATQEVASSWRFVTPLRVGTDFELAGPDKVPLDQKELKEHLGPDAVMDDPGPMQRQLAAAVYGIEDERRYEDLLHLLRTLRNPDVGVRAVEGQLEEYLSMSLPPLDHEVTRRLAVQFQDLESIRENMRRLSVAHEALSKFLLTYCRYAARMMRECADSVFTARESLSAHLEAVKGRARDLTDERTARASAHDALQELETLSRTLEAEIRELSGSPEYSDISARRQVVNAERESAASALSQAAACRAAEDMASTAVRTALQRAGEGARAADRADAAARATFGRAGLAPALLLAPPADPEVQFTTRTEQVPAGPAPDDPPAEVTRVEIPAPDLEALADGIRACAAQSERARQAAEERRVTASHLQKVAEKLEGEHDAVTALRTRAEDAAAAAERATSHRRDIAAEAVTEAQSWLDMVSRWLAAAPDSSALPEEPPALPTAVDLVSSADQADSFRSHFRGWAMPAVREAHAALTAAGDRLQALQDEGAALFEELDARRAGDDPLPPLPPHTASDRSGRPGAAFFQLVDFGPSLTERERAGLEAALQGSGLLNAWVSADGHVTDPDLQDLIATPEPQSPDSKDYETLLAALIPAPSPGCAVTPGTVTRLLASVRLADNPATSSPAGLVLSRTGRWRAGTLAGATRKDMAEHVGPATREASRLRRIAVLTALLEEWRIRRDLQRLRVEAAEASLAAWETHVNDFPTTSPVVVAQSLLARAKNTEAETEREARDRASAHAVADGIWQAKHGEFTRDASGAGLPETSSAITQRLTEIWLAIAATASLTSSLNDQYLPAVTQAARPLADFAAATSARKKGEAEALSRRDAYVRAEQALTLHIETLGFDSQEFDTRLSELKGRLDTANSEIPKVRERYEQAKRRVIRIETLQESDPDAERGMRQELATNEARFDNTLGTAGLWAAATGGDQPPPTARDDALQAAGIWSADTTEADLINALQALRTSLPVGYDARAIENDDVLAILVSDGEGSHPAATAATRTALRLAEHEEQLDARYQDIFEDFLLRDLAERLREQIDAADHLCHGMNDILAGAKSSQGIHVHLSWDPSPALDDATRDALALVRTSFTTRSPDQDARLRNALRELIEAERDKHDAHYAEVLTRALDYRDWYTFTVRVRDTGPDGQPRSRMLRRLSSGETRLVSYVTLFAAVAAFYDTLDTAGSTPLRIVLLDEAFERVDDPTKTRLLELLVDLDIDWVITWPGGSVLSPKINRMHIYDIFRPAGAPGMALVHATWDGIEARRGP
jgi:uncharacterized protein (TIGR02680 family)